jgi:hypothetical protein
MITALGGGIIRETRRFSFSTFAHLVDEGPVDPHAGVEQRFDGRNVTAGTG